MKPEERKFRILNAIITDYIKTAEPIGSRSLEKKHDFGISSATIRNEMSDLEDMGFLVQPHTSAGRIPSNKAYRLYVDKFMAKNKKLDKTTREAVKSVYDEYMIELNNAMESTLNILSKMTNYTALMTAPRFSTLYLKDIKVVYIDEDRIMLIIVTKEGLIKNVQVKLSTLVKMEELEHVNNALLELIRDIPLSELAIRLNDTIEGLSENEHEILMQIIPVLKDLVENSNSQNVYSKGESRILDYPEFKEIDRAKDFIDAVNRKDILQAIVKNDDDRKDLNITIGNENVLEAFRECSIITASYKLKGKRVGTIGVIGPTRMDYERTVATVDMLSQTLTEHIEKLFRK